MIEAARVVDVGTYSALIHHVIMDGRSNPRIAQAL